MTYQIKRTAIKDIASVERLNSWHQIQKQQKQPIYYLLPSTKWLHLARDRQPGLMFKTFDDIATRILDKSHTSFLPISEKERAILFQHYIKEENKGDVQLFDVEHHKIKAYADTYGQLKRLGLTINQLPSNIKRLEQLFEQYETETVHKRKLFDPENKILQAVKTSCSKEQLGLAGVVIDGYMDFSPLQFAIIQFLVSIEVPITIYLPLIKSANIIEETKGELIEIGFSLEEELIPESDRAKEVTIMKSTTIEEGVHAVFEQILNTTQTLDDFGLVIVDERNELPIIRKVAKEKQITLGETKTLPLKNTTIYQLLLATIREKTSSSNRWQKLQLLDMFMKITFLSAPYPSLKRNWLKNHDLTEPVIEMLFEKQHSFQEKLQEKQTFYDMVAETIEFLERLPLPTYWLEKLETENNTMILKKVRNEWKAYDLLIQLLKKQQTYLEERQWKQLTLTRENFIEWLKEIVENQSIYLERKADKSVGLYTFRDVALFSGKKLFIIGMNEGKFPLAYHLGGYFHESHLHTLPISYGKPTQATFRKKQDAYFEQLFYMAEELSFCYVAGIDQENPLLPSPYIEKYMKDQVLVYESSMVARLNTNVAFTSADLEEKIAYHIGDGDVIEKVPRHLALLKANIDRLATGEEIVSDKWGQILRQDKLAITMLESYAKCPFRYAMERVLAISEPLDEITNVSPLDTGSMLHQIIETFYQTMGLVNRSFSSMTMEEEQKAESVLLQVFEAEWEKISRSYTELSTIRLQIEKSQWKKKIKKWWAAEKNHFWQNEKLSDMKLFKLEQPITLKLSIDEVTLTLTGKIDRIDIDDDGFVIYDYKSGDDSLHLENHVRPGIKLQLPVYLLAMQETLTNEKQSIYAHGATYISIKDPAKRSGNGIWRNEHVKKDSRFRISTRAKNKEETLEGNTLLEKYDVKQRIKHLWQGSVKTFSVKPLECHSSCIYKSVCRVTEEQKEAGEGER